MQKDLPAIHDALIKGHCVPCEGGTTPLTNEEETNYLDATPGWQLKREITPHSLTREFEFNNFKEALSFVNGIGEIAESEGHHPNVALHDYKFVTVDLFTHAINGLSTNDFILAAKITKLHNS